MSEIEEPPAKVLKVDSVNGVTRVTEVAGLPEHLEGKQVMSEKADIIEGGADLEQGEGQEEWLSEGILTDDDYNPASQGERTDSIHGTSHDEDTANESMDHLDTTADSEANATGAENDTSTVKSETYTTKSAGNVSESGEKSSEIITTSVIESKPYTKTYDRNYGANTVESKANITESVTNITSNANKNSNVQEREPKKWLEQNIEETMKHLTDGAKEGDDTKTDIFDSLQIKKSDTKSEKKVKQEYKQEDDGNDTDDLLRMLGEDDTKTKKKLTKTVKDIRAAANTGNVSSDDDDFVFEGTTAKKLKAAKTALTKKQPIKAEPEDMEDGDDETEGSADETSDMKTLFDLKNKSNILAKQHPAKPATTPSAVVKRPPGNHIVNVVERPTRTLSKPPVKQYHNKRLSAKSILKPAPAPSPKPVFRAKAPAAQSPAVKKNPPVTVTIKKHEVKTPQPFKPSAAPAAVDRKSLERLKMEPDEIINEEEFLDEDEFDLDEDEFGESDQEVSRPRQRIMKPEVMDEEIPSDAESRSEDGSLYDQELPSSDSEDLDNWFQLDIRAEKAGDYIPLLGSRAKELLLEEKRRVAARLLNLKQSQTALYESGKKQAEQLRQATLALTELDDMLRAC